MPRKIVRTVYKFGELSEGARKNALQRLGERESECLDSADLTERIEEHVAYCHGLKLTALGKRKGDNGIYWSLRNCQGDGVAFDGLIDVDELVKPPEETGDPEHDKQFTTKELRAKIAEVYRRIDAVTSDISIQVRHRGNYYHRNSMEIEVEVFGPSFDHGDVPEQVMEWVRNNNAPLGLENDSWQETVEAAMTKDPPDFLPVMQYCDWLESKGARDIAFARALCAGSEAWDRQVDALKTLLEDYVKEVSESAEEFGYAEIEYQTSDEDHLAELAEANGWEFEENGDIA